MTDYVSGWAVDATSGAIFAVLPTAIAVPSSASFNAGRAFSQDGYRYAEVVTNVPAGAAFIGGVAHRHDGAVYIVTSAPASFPKPGITPDGAIYVNSTGPAVVSNAGIPYANNQGLFGGVVDLSAVDYDGTNDYATLASDLTGMADGKQGTFSAWVRIDGGDGATRTLLTNNVTFSVYLGTDNKFTIAGANTTPTLIMDLRASAILADTTWRHFLASWDLTSASKRHLYVNDVSDLTVAAYTNDTIDYTRTSWGFGGFSDSTNKLNGCLAQQFFHPVYIDLSVEANRRKFITATGRPAFLGPTGALPLGVQPLIYVQTGDPSANSGSGGNFTVVGTLTACSSLPGI